MEQATIFEPRVLQRTHCANCGAARTTHDYATKACPVAYRPDTYEQAEREYWAARQGGDAGRVFSARGELQRLAGRADHAFVDSLMDVNHAGAHRGTTAGTGPNCNDDCRCAECGRLKFLHPTTTEGATQ